MDRRIFIYSVTASLIAAITVSWILEPSIKWVWNYATVSTSSWLNKLQDEAFRNAALGKRDWVSAVMLLWWISTCFAILAGFVVAVVGIIIGKLLAKKGVAERVKPAWIKRLLGIGLSVPALGLLYQCYMWGRLFFLVYVDLQLNASFFQRLDALGPYMEVTDERRLKSGWARMTSREDYERINEQLEQLAKKANIKLPEPLYR